MTDVPIFDLRQAGEDERDVLAWLWQAYRSDMAPMLGALPYPDGRYKRAHLERLNFTDDATYVAWRPHPNTGESAPIGFAIVEGLSGPRRSIGAFWTAPAVRRQGIGHALALAVIHRHRGPWDIAFQHDNRSAGALWRRVADAAFGVGRWTETERAVPGHTDVPPDHWIAGTVSRSQESAPTCDSHGSA